MPRKTKAQMLAEEEAERARKRRARQKKSKEADGASKSKKTSRKKKAKRSEPSREDFAPPMSESRSPKVKRSIGRDIEISEEASDEFGSSEEGDEFSHSRVSDATDKTLEEAPAGYAITKAREREENF